MSSASSSYYDDSPPPIRRFELTSDAPFTIQNLNAPSSSSPSSSSSSSSLSSSASNSSASSASNTPPSSLSSSSSSNPSPPPSLLSLASSNSAPSMNPQQQQQKQAQAQMQMPNPYEMMGLPQFAAMVQQFQQYPEMMTFFTQQLLACQSHVNSSFGSCGQSNMNPLMPQDPISAAMSAATAAMFSPFNFQSMAPAPAASAHNASFGHSIPLFIPVPIPIPVHVAASSSSSSQENDNNRESSAAIINAAATVLESSPIPLTAAEIMAQIKQKNLWQGRKLTVAALTRGLKNEGVKFSNFEAVEGLSSKISKRATAAWGLTSKVEWYGSEWVVRMTTKAFSAGSRPPPPPPPPPLLQPIVEDLNGDSDDDGHDSNTTPITPTTMDDEQLRISENIFSVLKNIDIDALSSEEAEAILAAAQASISCASSSGSGSASQAALASLLPPISSPIVDISSPVSSASSSSVPSAASTLSSSEAGDGFRFSTVRDAVIHVLKNCGNKMLSFREIQDTIVDDKLAGMTVDKRGYAQGLRDVTKYCRDLFKTQLTPCSSSVVYGLIERQHEYPQYIQSKPVQAPVVPLESAPSSSLSSNASLFSFSSASSASSSSSSASSSSSSSSGSPAIGSDAASAYSSDLLFSSSHIAIPASLASSISSLSEAHNAFMAQFAMQDSNQFSSVHVPAPSSVSSVSSVVPISLHERSIFNPNQDHLDHFFSSNGDGLLPTLQSAILPAIPLVSAAAAASSSSPSSAASPVAPIVEASSESHAALVRELMSVGSQLPHHARLEEEINPLSDDLTAELRVLICSGIGSSEQPVAEEGPRSDDHHHHHHHHSFFSPTLPALTQDPLDSLSASSSLMYDHHPFSSDAFEDSLMGTRKRGRRGSDCSDIHLLQHLESREVDHELEQNVGQSAKKPRRVAEEDHAF